ncbi:MAG TPA: hypothetical protein VKA27_08030 [Sunxiuqinia sp.]|nr:hypothetical protein [Sunxiuqinia sp.]
MTDWINADIQYSYYQQLLNYPDRHRKYNHLSKDWRINENYYDFIQNVASITPNELINSDSQWLINSFLYNYVWEIAWNSRDSISKNNFDSLIFHKIIELTPKTGIVRQLTLNEFINSKLSNYKLAFYDKNKKLINSLIQENYLIEPIHDHYSGIEALLNKPAFAKDIKISGINDQSASALWQRILRNDKGNVIYIDCWATWCGACISEFPNSKQMMEEYE